MNPISGTHHPEELHREDGPCCAPPVVRDDRIASAFIALRTMLERERRKDIETLLSSKDIFTAGAMFAFVMLKETGSPEASIPSDLSAELQGFAERTKIAFTYAPVFAPLWTNHK